MVATRSILLDKKKASADTETELRRCIRDLVALSSLPGIWFKADANQIVDSLAQLVVSILDVDCACVFLGSPNIKAVQYHDRVDDIVLDLDLLRAGCPDNSAVEYHDPKHGKFYSASVPLGRESNSVLIALSRRPDFPNESEQMLIRVAANQAAIAIERWRTEARLLHQAHTLQKLHQTGTLVAANLDTDAIIQAVTDAATELTGAQFGAFFYNVVNDSGENYMLYSLSGVPKDAFSRFPLPRNTAIFGPTFHGRGIVRSSNIRKDPLYGKNPPFNGMPEGHLPVTSYLAVPVISRSGEVFGGLFFGHEKEGIFSEESETIVSGIAAQAAVALDNAKLYASARQEIEERQRVEAHQNLLLAELNHRVKNTLAIIQSVATQTLRYTTSPQAFNEAFIERLQALSTAHNLLTDSNWKGAALSNILTMILDPFSGSETRFRLEGPETIVKPQDAIALVMLLHELGTNCVKYGAWSVTDGQVLVHWHMSTDEKNNVVVVNWQESGGPIVTPPTRKGLGSKLIDRAIAEPHTGYIQFLPEGIICSFGIRASPADM